MRLGVSADKFSKNVISPWLTPSFGTCSKEINNASVMCNNN